MLWGMQTRRTHPTPRWKVVVSMMMYWDGLTWTNGYGTWMGIAMMFLLVVAVIAIVFAVLALRRRGARHQGIPRPIPIVTPTSPQDDPACEAARRRYARGEISEDELDEICSTLGAR